MYSAEFDEKWVGHFEAISPAIKERIAKKLRQILDGLLGRHLGRGSPFFVEEIGQYGICYASDEKRKARRFYFVGDHKEYERWLGL